MIRSALVSARGKPGGYTPRYDTIADRTADHLRKQGPGAKLPAAVLCKLLGISSKRFSAHLITSRRNGVFVAEKRLDGRGMLWSLGGSA